MPAANETLSSPPPEMDAEGVYPPDGPRATASMESPAAAESPSCDPRPAVGEQLAVLQNQVKLVGDALARLQSGSDGLAHLTGQLLETQKLGAEQIRRFGKKLDQAGAALSQGRFKDLAVGLALFYDLLVGLVANQEKENDGAGARTLHMLLGQLKQLLTSSGIDFIAAEGHADYQVHRAVKQVPASSPEQDGQIVELWRAGFRIGDQVLRPAEVVIAAYTAPNPGATEPRP